jgi:hypothetical protein
MATAANVVKFKRSAVAGKVPATTDLNLGEIALNTYDGRVYLKKSVASVESIVTLQPFPTGGTNGQILSLDSSGNLIWVTSSVTSSGTVTSVSVTSANGFAGTVANSTTTPAITISTSVTGLLKGNGTAISAASAGTDYLAPNSLSITTNSAGAESLTYSNGVFTFTPADLSSYVTSTSLSSTLGSYVTSTSLSSTLSSYVTSTSLSSTLGSYVTSSTLSSYNYITLTALSMDTPGTASGSGSVTYSNTTGKFKYTPPDLSSFITASVATLSSLTTIGSSGVDTTAAGNLIVTGNLTVNGTTETINSTTVSVADKNIELGKVATPTDTTANGGGITLKGATDKTLNWVLSTSSWTSSENIDLASGKTYKINGTDVLSSTTLGANVVNSSLTSVGTLTNLSVTNTITGSVSGNAGTATKLATARNINGVSFDGSADITITAAAGTLTGDTLSSGVTKSSLTQVGTLTNLSVTNTITGSVSGNAGTVTNGVYTTGSYANPTWITSIDYSKITNAPSAQQAVLYDTSQSLTENQQAQARANIDAISTGDAFIFSLIF